MRIRDIDNPETFQRFCQALLAAEYGKDFQVVDDSGGDAGNDGYLPFQKTLFAIYCPEKKLTPERLRAKIVKDLDKTVKLRDDRGYEIHTWIFITPMDLREPMQRFVRNEAKARELVGLCMGEQHLQDLFLKHEHLHDKFTELASPRIFDALAELKKGIEGVRDDLRRITEEESAEPHVSRPMPTFSPSENFLQAQELLSAGRTEEGFAILEKLRLEDRDLRERLYATMLIVESLNRPLHLDRIHQLAKEALQLAEEVQDHVAIAAMKSQIGWGLNERYVALDMDTYYMVLATSRIGIPFISEQQIADAQRKLESLERDSETHFAEAIELAREKRLYRILAFILCQYANAATNRINFYQHVPSLMGRVLREKEAVFARYETAIRIAVALSDAYLLAQCYHNYANDLRMFGELELARTHLENARQIAEKNGFQDIILLSRELEKRIS